MGQREDAKDPCKKQACRIQKCLKQNSFDEAYCFDYIDSMRRCCGTWKAKSCVCDGFLKEMRAKDETPTQNAELFVANSYTNTLPRRNIPFTVPT